MLIRFNPRKHTETRIHCPIGVLIDSNFLKSNLEIGIENYKYSSPMA